MKPEDIAELKQLIDFLKENQVAEFDLDRGDLKIRLKFVPQQSGSAGLGELGSLLGKSRPQSAHPALPASPKAASTALPASPDSPPRGGRRTGSALSSAAFPRTATPISISSTAEPRSSPG